ncbi:MAG TPA: LAGLIDADG family homing endonuclease [Arenibaculum sp.]|nr:LAGLIDADG family homing endonuclease [Arenibaculum sp.]
MPTVAAISRQIWDMKYRLKSPDGQPVDNSVEDTWRRVAHALSRVEEKPEYWEARFYDAMAGFQFLPAGRILAGAGTGRAVTLFNCFVMGTIGDNLDSIFDNLREAALTMQQGGGIGYDFSTIRPKGAPVRGVGADASGPLSFMDVWDSMCRTIMSAGARRGAMMATLRCDHPEIEDFIDAKHEAGRLRMFNLSVLVTDAFMDAVRQDAAWPLTFGGTVFRTVPARDLWNRIMRSTYAYAEPGVIFIDRVNQMNNLHYAETISATNPCVTADTWVQTADGPRKVAELVGRPFTAVVAGARFSSAPEGFFPTGVKPVLRIVTRDGFVLRATGDHRVRTAATLRSGTGPAWTRAGDLRPGDVVVLNDHGDDAGWTGRHGEAEGYLMGLPAASGHGERHREPGGLERLAAGLGVAPGGETITPAVERTSGDFHRGFLRGLFDADGTVLDDHATGVAIRLAHRDPGRMAAVQRMLLRLGIVARLEPGGKDRDADHELTIAHASAARFAERIGFTGTDKRVLLTAALERHGGRLESERFLAEVAAVVEDGVEQVFDVRIPGANAFDANGLLVHNCGEQPLPPYGACLLGSINLATLVRDPFTERARLDMDRLGELVPTAVRMMDDVVDVSRFPLPQQEAEARAKRRIGLGVTGLADALIMCRARYGSERAVSLTQGWMKAIRRSAYLASTGLAAEKGAFPLFERDAYLRGANVAALEDEVREAIARNGIRNALLTSIAPTGTISLLADNVSSGIEPVFSYAYTRSVLLADGSRRTEQVSDHAYRRFRETFGDDVPLPEYFVDAQTLAPGAHVVMQAVAQKYVDSSISKTINCPEDLPFEAFESVYFQAYEMGCKGCTTYRPNEVTGAVLSVNGSGDGGGTGKPGAVGTPQPGGVVYMTRPLDRPEALPGQTYKVRWPESDHALYITINDILQDGRRRPFEVFINSKNMEHYAWTVALTRMISAVFRRGGDVSFVVDELKAVFDPRGGQWVGGRYVPSLLAAIGEVIERHMVDIGFLPTEDARRQRKAGTAQGTEPGRGPAPRVRQCPKCGQPGLQRQEGCDLCPSCGYSKCG